MLRVAGRPDGPCDPRSHFTAHWTLDTGLWCWSNSICISNEPRARRPCPLAPGAWGAGLVHWALGG